MVVQYASDLHLEFSDNWNYLKQNPIQPVGDILILAGDIGYLGDDNYSKHPFWDWASQNYKQVIVTLGNHEFYKYYDISTLEDGLCGEIRNNVHYYYNSVVRIDDVDIIISTLWSHILLEDAYATENCVSDFRRIMYGDSILTFTEFNTEHVKCLAFLKNAVENSSALKRIVVTHHVPSFRLVSLEFKGSKINGAFVAELFDFISDSNLDFWIYGHSHRNIDATIGTTKCVSNQLGYVFKNEHMTFDNQRCFII